MKLQTSLRQKITLGYLGYYVIAALIVGLSLFTYIELRVIEGKIRAGEHIAELFDATLEIRRFEKNYFLYRQQEDFNENMLYVAKVKGLLASNGADFSTLAAPSELSALNLGLGRYAELMGEYARLGAGEAVRADGVEQSIRAAGKEVLNVAERMARTERRLIQSALDRFRVTLIVAIVFLSLLMIGLGRALSKMVVRPLRHMESCVEAVSAGKLDKLPMPSEDREVVSITNAFNHMLGELELRQQGLLRAEKLASLGTMLSGVAHELNNPLSNISTSCQILLEEFDRGDPEHMRELLEQIDEQTDRASQIVRALLDFSRDRESARKPWPLDDLIRETLRFLSARRRDQGKVATDIPADLTVVGNKPRLQQAFLNLIKNALDAVGSGGQVTVSAAVRRRAELGDALESGRQFTVLNMCPTSDRLVEIQVSDNGPGIRPEDLPKIFDPFFTTKDIGQGSGLGLFVVYQIIEEHNGCIAVETSPGEGTRFLVRLPLDIPSNQINGNINGNGI